MKNFFKPCLVALAVTSFFHHDVSAYEAGDLVFRVGAAHVQPQDESTPLTLDGVELSKLGLPKSTADVGSNSQLGLTFSYFLDNNWAVSLLAATPFSHAINVEALDVKAGETKHLPPTLTVQYFPMTSDSALQPYLGLGVNYTKFFDEQVDASLDNTLKNLGATGNAKMDIDASWGLAAELGLDYKLSNNISINAAMWYLDIDTEARITSPALGTLETDVTIDPLTYMLGIAFNY